MVQRGSRPSDDVATASNELGYCSSASIPRLPDSTAICGRFASAVASSADSGCLTTRRFMSWLNGMLGASHRGQNLN